MLLQGPLTHDDVLTAEPSEFDREQPAATPGRDWWATPAILMEDDDEDFEDDDDDFEWDDDDEVDEGDEELAEGDLEELDPENDDMFDDDDDDDDL